MFTPIDTSEFSTPELLSKVRECQKHITDSLPSAVDPLSFPNIKSKTPYIAVCYREVQYFRFEEFTRGACDAFENNNTIVAITCARAMLESAASIWYLMNLLRHEVSVGLTGGAHDKIVQLLMGQKADPESGLPEAKNILSILDKVDKDMPGIRKHYERLSEFAHPNWNSSLGTFGETDKQTLITWFRPNAKGLDFRLRAGLDTMMLTMQMVENCYNEVLDSAIAYSNLEMNN